MKKIKNKSIAIIIATILTLSMTSSLMSIPNANAVTLAPGKISIPTYAFINVAPSPAGLGQAVNIGFWLAQPPPTASGQYGDRWQNMTVKVTEPNGNTQTLGPFTSDDTGGSHATYTPTTVGNYTFQMSFSGQILAGNNPAPPSSGGAYIFQLIYGVPFIGDYYEPSTSTAVTLVVQQTATPSFPEAPLPTSYWTRPIESVNDMWGAISGNWLGLGELFEANTGMYNASGDYNPYTTAPTTAHILWTIPEAFGGVIGGEFSTSGSPATNYYSTRQYERMFAPVIMQGILYYTEYPEVQQLQQA